MEIRKIKTDEKDAIKAFSLREWEEPDQVHFRGSVPDFSKIDKTLVAKEGEKIVGYVKFFVQAEVGSIDSLIVGKSFRGKGIGSALIENAEQEMKKLGAHKVWLETGKDWKAKELYEKHGYTLRAELPKHYGGEGFLLMDKML